MYKKANHSEQFSELFIQELGLALRMNMAVYERGDGCVKTPDFTNGASVNLEPALSFMGDNQGYPDVAKVLQKLCPAAIPDYVRMIFLDTIIANPDRHTGNFGLLRDVETGKLHGLAPVFDHNMALIARGYPKPAKNGDLLITLLNEFLDEYPEYRQFIPDLTEQTVFDAIDRIHMKVRTQTVVDFIMKRYALIQKESLR